MVNDLAALRKEAQDLGLVPTAEDVAMADDLGDAWDKVRSVMAAAVFKVGAALAPMLLPAVEIVKNIAVSVGKWVKENGTLFRTIALIGAGLLVVGTAIVGIGAALSLMGVAAGGLAVLFSPAGLIVAGIVLLVATIVAGVAAWVRFTDSGQLAGKAVAAAMSEITNALEIVFSLLISGRWELAGRAIGNSIKLGILASIADITSIIPGLGDKMAEVFNSAFRDQMEIAAEIVNALALDKKLKADKAAALPFADLGIETIKQPASQTAMTTHQALALTFGQKQMGAKNEEKQLLKDIKMAIKQGDKEWLAISKDMLRELRKGRAVVGP
jgi:hypothetical protein